MTYVIRVVGYARPKLTCEFVGQYLEWFDPDIIGDQATMARFTENLARAKKFPSIEAAFAEWQRVRTITPVRPDGRPNRPLTAFTVIIDAAQ